MAKVVLGLATSHSPQMTVPWQHWEVMRRKDEVDPRLDYTGLMERAKPGLDKELTPEKWEARYNACQQGIATLGEKLREARPDVVVVLGDDQHEQFQDDNMPAISLYHGDKVPVLRLRHDRETPEWKLAEERCWAQTAPEYEGAPDLALHLIHSLIDQEFDVARTNHLRETIGIGHAFSFLYRRILPGGQVPMVPVMLNTYFPPNQPTPRRCYRLGQALRHAVESWDSDARVALMASGGLSHVIMDEDIDEQTLGGLQNKRPEQLFALPRERLHGGTSEILNWVALAGAMEAEPFHLVDYVPCYRSLAATGCGAGFAYWA